MKHWAYFAGLAVCVHGTLALGDEASVPVWRCGNHYTNQPLPDQSCESVSLSRMEETQVPQPAKPAPSSSPVPAPKPPTPRVDALVQRERDGQAKEILSHELKRLNARCQAVTDTQSQQRCAADQAALKRELSRIP